MGPSLREFARYPRNFFNPRIWGLVRSQRRFARRALASLQRGDLGDTTLGAYLQDLAMDRFFIDNYLVPLAASVWSSPDKDMLDFPAETFLRFFNNHGMIQVRDIPRWQTVVGGSCAYIDRFRSLFPGTIKTSTPVRSVAQQAETVLVTTDQDTPMSFDQVVLATHADQSLALLSDATTREKEALSAWRYHRSSVVLHSDPSVMPPDRRLWASWNYRRPTGAAPGDPVPITYCMNRLQGLAWTRDYLVSLNLKAPVDPDHLIYSVEYTHPAYTPACIAAQQQLRAHPADRRIHFCGSYMGYGFHEDAAASAHEVAHRIGDGS